MNIKFVFNVFSTALLCLAVAGCSSTNRAYYDTIKLALAADEPVTLSVDQVRASQADLLQVKSGERAPAVMALAFIENGRNKWVSADKAQLHIHHGVIVTTHGLDNDLLFTGNLDDNPLAEPFPLAFDWSRSVDIKGVGYGLPVSSQWLVAGEARISILSSQFAVQRIEETISFPKTTPYIETGLSWKNTYWISRQNGDLLRASVKLTPQSDRFEMTYLSRAARLLEESQ